MYFTKMVLPSKGEGKITPNLQQPVIITKQTMDAYMGRRWVNKKLNVFNQQWTDANDRK